MSEPTATPRTPSCKRRSWPLRWSLRVMIAVITLICIAFAWLGHIWHLGQVHEEVGNAIEMTYAEEIRKFGFTGVTWRLSEQLKFSRGKGIGGPIGAVESQVKHAPQWMRVTGFDRFWQRIDSIYLHSRLPPENIEVVVTQVPRLDHLGLLHISGSRFPEAKLAAMVGSIRLDRLHATHASLGQGPMPWLRHTGLKELNLSHTQFSDAAVDDLPVSLQRLELEDTQLTDTGMAKLARLKNLKFLILRGMRAHDETFVELKAKLPGCIIDWDTFESEELKQQRRKLKRRERRLQYEREHGITSDQN
ncbi:hypothetical protein [Bremerella alba]|uniref:Leucine Rich repeats (2 copies) n=1 Tax=Bremerella alba TaxID=980252 RepID=A0A7V8V1R3_9BACT|nr:hypothetical protein [Bremerella alba]MBA2113264.1 hypothetical protein [Bremerella alba]